MLTLWKSMVLPILDYCSQLWSPTKVGEIQQIEQVQKKFTRKIRNNSQEDHWCRLNSNNLYSLERRRERYRIIYVWKILEGMVPNLSGQSELCVKPSLRFSRMCSVPQRPTSAPSRIQNLRDGSFSNNRPRLFNLFNSLPYHIRNMSGVDILRFKNELDEYLRTVADEPLSPGYTTGRRAAPNSLLHMIPASRQEYANIFCV